MNMGKNRNSYKQKEVFFYFHFASLLRFMAAKVRISHAFLSPYGSFLSYGELLPFECVVSFLRGCRQVILITGTKLSIPTISIVFRSIFPRSSIFMTPFYVTSYTRKSLLRADFFDRLGPAMYIAGLYVCRCWHWGRSSSARSFSNARFSIRDT